MSDRQCAPTRREARRRKIRQALRWPWMRYHQLPGYGRAYQATERFLHRHGYCVMTRLLVPDEDGKWHWWCRWCGNRGSRWPHDGEPGYRRVEQETRLREITRRLDEANEPAVGDEQAREGLT